MTFPLLLIKQVFTNEDGSTGIQYLVTSDTTLDGGSHPAARQHSTGMVIFLLWSRRPPRLSNWGNADVPPAEAPECKRPSFSPSESPASSLAKLGDADVPSAGCLSASVPAYKPLQTGTYHF
ncbi:MAG: hypothetical protein DDG59_10725 [Anaerolineae bacterium]|nr:MAG: hypothetical protein DDG59_10725 [Anaerolineae bacterium]